MKPERDPTPAQSPPKEPLRWGFSTGTAMTAAALAALRRRLSGESPAVVAVRLPAGFFLPVPIRESGLEGHTAWASVTKDGGDDPDVTHRAEIRVTLRCSSGNAPGIYLTGGKGVGTVTKAGLPVTVGEPAVNPVPREMLACNLTEELLRRGESFGLKTCEAKAREASARPAVFLPFTRSSDRLSALVLEVEVEVDRGEELARHTLNPRLGVVGGISILGTTGLVKPFSHKAYEETIQAALSVAASNGCKAVVLSTGGKSEHFAREILAKSPQVYASESFVQIADFFAFAVREAVAMGFERIVHSTFFGKAVKMAQGHPYTHAHEVPLDLEPLARLAGEHGCTESFCRRLAAANTAREALELLRERGPLIILHEVARQALEQSKRIGGGKPAVRLLLFDYDGSLLADLEQP